jgi:hypothetical protein
MRCANVLNFFFATRLSMILMRCKRSDRALGGVATRRPGPTVGVHCPARRFLRSKTLLDSLLWLCKKNCQRLRPSTHVSHRISELDEGPLESSRKRPGEPCIPRPLSDFQSLCLSDISISRTAIRFLSAFVWQIGWYTLLTMALSLELLHKDPRGSKGFLGTIFFRAIRSLAYPTAGSFIRLGAHLHPRFTPAPTPTTEK